MPEQNEKIFSVLSLFSGGGLLDLGFINNGFQIEEALEINESFIQGYNYAIDNYLKNSSNFFVHTKKIMHKQILQGKDVSDKKIQISMGKRLKGITGLIGGPPCQDYSVGGKNEGVEGSRGKLIFSYLNLVKRTHPKFLFFENVEGLYKNKTHRVSFLALCNELESLGYILWYDIVNPLSYGLPQDRPRIIVVGFRKGIVRRLLAGGFIFSMDNALLKTTDNDNFIFKWPKVQFENVKISVDWPGMWDFGTGEDRISFIPREYEKLQVNYAFNGLNDTTPNQLDRFNPKSNKFSVISEGDTRRKSFKRLHRFRYSPTVAYGNNEVHLHPTEPRRISVREALRLQTVPDEYVLPSDITLSTKYKIISNGVPSKQAELIASEIRKTLIRYQDITGDEI
ncbi:DNA cytosine methyltransferase [Paenibacillus sp. FSL R10-2734]|uniref:DNA cytosine methyltransferase n=1 Tax=Paenibacillus sp. FSL R10-2734 TaxID=2954691 RepID=UPI0030DBA531